MKLRSFFLCVAFSVTMACTLHADVTTGLQGWWKFDEGAGDQVDDSSLNSNVGIRRGNSQWVANGLIDGAMAFNPPANGTTDYLDLGNVSFGLSNEMTISLWGYLDAETGTYQTFIMRGEYVNPYSIQYYPSNRYRVRLRTASGILT